MNVSENGLKCLAEFEEEVDHVYRDAAGLPTIGLGHLLTRSELMSGYITIQGQSVRLTDGLTHEQAYQLLDQDLEPAESIVNKLVQVTLSQNEFDALVCFAFNIGTGGFAASSALDAINHGEFNEVPDCMRKWNKITQNGHHVVCQGLVNRREKEIALWLLP